MPAQPMSRQELKDDSAYPMTFFGGRGYVLNHVEPISFLVETEALYLICCSCLCENNSLLATLGGAEPRLK